MGLLSVLLSQMLHTTGFGQTTMVYNSNYMLEEMIK